MSTYIITYFISDTCGCGCGHDHHEHAHEHNESSEDSIIAKIKSIGAWANFMPEGYLVKTELSSEEILQAIQSVSNKGDIIFVTKADADSTACTIPPVVDWMKQ